MKKFRIVRWYDEQKITTHVFDFEEAYKEYTKETNCDVLQVYILIGASETPFLLAQKEC